MHFSKLILSVCALITMNGCAYIIPPEQNAPRHNTVLGGPRRPQMNLISGPLSALTPPDNAANYAAAAPVVPVTVATQQVTQSDAVPAAPVLPPVDPAVKAQAERELAAANTILVPTGDVSRRLPVENQPFQVAGNYPTLDSVPPRPALTGADSTQSRLNATQADLERERAQALQSKEVLARDAAAEPSMLSPMPAAPSVAPAATTPALPAATLPSAPRSAPIGNGASATPTNDPMVIANATPAPRIVLPTTPITTQFSVPTGPNFAPPTPLNMASLNMPASQPVRIVPVPQPTASAPVVITPTISAPARTISTTNQRQPIVLRAPVPYEAETTRPAIVPAPSRGGITVRPGDFDPLTGADNSPLSAPSTTTAQSTSTSTLADYATNRAISPSRYGSTRN